MQSPPLPRPAPTQAGWLAGLACCVCCVLLNLEMKCSFCCCHRCSSNLHKSTAISRIRNEKCISRGSIDSTRLHRYADKRGREVGRVGGSSYPTAYSLDTDKAMFEISTMLVSAININSLLFLFLFILYGKKEYSHCSILCVMCAFHSQLIAN